MRPFYILTLFTLLGTTISCKDTKIEIPGVAYNTTKSIAYNGVQVDVVIDKPVNNEVDVFILYHGTVIYDDKILEAANNTLEEFRKIIQRTDIMFVSVAYPEENLLMGDNIAHAEAALLWVKNKASQELGITVKKIFLGGHSQGGYLVTRLNTMHETNGVIANGPGPLNLVYRCQLEENGQIPNGITCTLLKNTYGTTSTNPGPYFERSLLNFTMGFKSPILFVQGLNDTPIQMYSWPIFKQQIMDCLTCQNSEFFEVPNAGHTALFDNEQAKDVFNDFINKN